MKLNLGCGYNKQDGFLNVDASDACSPDKVWDLERTPWEIAPYAVPEPLEDSTVSEVLLTHVLEHLGQTPQAFKAIIQELYRVCLDGALIRITVPHPRHDDFLGDPTHVRAIVPQLFDLLNREACEAWKQQGGANSLLAFEWGVDFRHATAPVAVLDPSAAHWEHDPQLQVLMQRQLGIVKEWRMVIRAVKS